MQLVVDVVARQAAVDAAAHWAVVECAAEPVVGVAVPEALSLIHI